jgi:hypothetical protein
LRESRGVNSPKNTIRRAAPDPDPEGETSMAKLQEETRRRGEMAFGALFDPSSTVASLEPLFQAGNKWIEAWMAVGTEILQFSKARLDRSVEMSKAIARTSSIEQAVDLQTDYTRAMMRDYIDEAGKLADMGTRTLLDGFIALQSAARHTGAAARTQ